MDEVWGDPSPIETDADSGFSSGNLTVGRVTFRPVPISVMRNLGGRVFGGFLSTGQPCPVSRHRVEVDDLNRRYQTQTNTIVVDKRTHRIRYENETESEVTIIIEPK